MSQKVTVLVNRTALDRQALTPESGDCGLKTRRTINGHQGGLSQAAGIQILKELSPRDRALPRHVLKCQEHLLPIPSHTHCHQH